MEEKDLFDMFREGSENLTEQPATDSWKRLERRLASAKDTKKRRNMPLQLMVVVATVALLLTAGAVNWIVARDHQARLQNQKDFEKLQFLVGKWSASDRKIVDELIFKLQEAPITSSGGRTPIQTPKILRGIKTVSFKETVVQNDTFLIENRGRQTVFKVKNQAYELKNVNNSAFLFIAADGSVVRLRQGSNDRFTLSFGEGQIFLYKK